MASNMPPGYSDEGAEIAERGEDTALYDALQKLFYRYRDWLKENLEDFWTVEQQELAAKICNDLEKLLCDIEGPL